MSDLLSRASEYHAQGQEDYARGLVHQAIQQDPNNAEAWSMAMELARSERERKQMQSKMWQAMEGQASGSGPFPFAPVPPGESAAAPSPAASPFPSRPALPSYAEPPMPGHTHIPPDPLKHWRVLFANQPLEHEGERSYLFPAFVAMIAAYTIPGGGIAAALYWLWQARQIRDAGVQTRNVGCLWALISVQVIGICVFMVMIAAAFFNS